MTHAETDRKAYYRDLQTSCYEEFISIWLKDNPETGSLNSRAFCVIKNGQQIDVSPFSIYLRGLIK